ncbi:3-demethoxyubiquinol 3-hydroxylase [Tatumella citrea]|uniref:2-octaprenyl-3-methyl-6-methoxy-1,4-benzoquinol hydroxylase n=1 Tax=Tatumella citrea TaxID=53336 RepID=A0A1Y0L5S6_TATCI|nr:3-demethoxyubiquinol 3-hydroxylase [Tatumella citrea]ARU93386.1 2-octaprenyl-3-methyl-6-methoxy-1,4-benzoquinol hydroxylase [Tatumella citrea]ARU97424.1 2-octaprenyl-3-methyl-6-methoxy-1,4-benzoquinol hydroxylase [Tatumella citrea]
MQQQQFDVVITGAGMVGAALACGLARHHFRVAVIEHQQPRPFDPLRSPDVRISAIGAASVALLKELDVWDAIVAMRCAAYRRLETWEWQNAHAVFDAASLGLPELGFMVENSVLQWALWEKMQAQGITVICPASVSAAEYQDEYWNLTLDNQQQISTRLWTGADGANSQVRRLAGIGVSGWDYSQSCMLISVECEDSPGDSTWQQFTPQGPRAFLPLYDNFASLVWYDSVPRIRQLVKLTPEQLTEEVTRHFPSRLGKVRVLSAGAFPLTRRHASQYVRPGLALVGDAAHTINPLAGQGVNLGYRDVDALIDILAGAKRTGSEWWQMPVLKRYQRQRYKDNLLMQNGMDLFYLAFSNQSHPLMLARNLGLMAAQRGGWLKKKALSYALGL